MEKKDKVNSLTGYLRRQITNIDNLLSENISNIIYLI